jgi:hypothetical protein
MRTVEQEQDARPEHVLPQGVQDALGELAGAAKEGLLALGGGRSTYPPAGPGKNSSTKRWSASVRSQPQSEHPQPTPNIPQHLNRPAAPANSGWSKTTLRGCPTHHYRPSTGHQHPSPAVTPPIRATNPSIDILHEVMRWIQAHSI